MRICYTDTSEDEAESLEVLQEWAANWDDVTGFTFIPVMSSHEMSEKMKK